MYVCVLSSVTQPGIGRLTGVFTVRYGMSPHLYLSPSRTQREIERERERLLPVWHFLVALVINLPSPPIMG